MAIAHGTARPLLTIATPVTRPHAATPGMAGTEARTPRHSSARQAGSKEMDLLTRTRLRPDVFDHFANCIDDCIGTFELNVVVRVFQADLATAR